MNMLLRVFISVIPILLLPYYFSFQEWGTEKQRKICGYVVGFLWACAFGAFCGTTGFLRS
jgi:hypothetical protein